jgi:hypothetical protein
MNDLRYSRVSFLVGLSTGVLLVTAGYAIAQSYPPVNGNPSAQIAMAADADFVYVIREGQFYRSGNGGVSWERRASPF